MQLPQLILLTSVWTTTALAAADAQCCFLSGTKTDPYFPTQAAFLKLAKSACAFQFGGPKSVLEAYGGLASEWTAVCIRNGECKATNGCPGVGVNGDWYSQNGGTVHYKCKAKWDPKVGSAGACT